MDNNDPIQSMIDEYKKHISKTQLKDEVYKWALVNEYKGRPNPKADDFYHEIKDIKFDNLIYHLSIAAIHQMAKEKPEEIRQLFIELYDESRDLTKRVKNFNKQTLILYRDLEETLSHHQDERSIATYLTFHNSDKYTFYKYSYYKKYCNLLGIKIAKKNQKYTHYLQLIDDLIEKYIAIDKELIEHVKTYIPEFYDGTSHKLLAQDILYQMLEMKKKTNYWIFQGNPDFFDFETALRQKLLTGWTVTAHKNKIQVGDKVILWITGRKSGCYALAEVTSEPHQRTSSSPDDHLWKTEATSELIAGIKIIHNLVDNPILKAEIGELDELKKLKAGSQGTNFSATEEEYQAILKISENKTEKQYWLYSPGENARKWDEFYRKGIMGLGWDEIGDLKQYKNRDEIKQGLVDAYGGEGSKKNDVSANDDFLNKMNIGDVIIAKKGRGELLGYGIVTSNYEYDKDLAEFQHIREIDWKLKGSWEVNFNLITKTLTDITKYPSEHPNYKKYYGYLLGIMGQEDIENNKLEEMKIKFPLNTILYGPPGTGKTYNTINEALRIIDNDFLNQNINDREILNERFRELRFNPENEEGQIAFITFHQSLSYEDFIEGIKPLKPIDNEPISYDIIDGLFKSISNKASKGKDVVSFDKIYDEFKNDILENQSFRLKTLAQKKTFDVRINGKGNCVVQPQTEAATEMVVTKKMILDYLLDGTIRDWKPYVTSLAEYIKTTYNFQLVEINNSPKPYVLIIDEINRGNVSQIFGELITLIESDKRKGQAEEIEVILPYSNDKFSVPSNLYIIGTMNTADRSVEALDTALRRRFSFIEMNPDPSKLSSEEFQCDDIDLESLLTAINARIEKLMDKDYCIGHSYFMTIKNRQEPLEEIKSIFQNKILPLLQEYFYGDWGKIRLVIGKEFVEINKGTITFLSTDSYEDYEEYDEKPIYNFTNPSDWTIDSFKSIYE